MKLSRACLSFDNVNIFPYDEVPLQTLLMQIICFERVVERRHRNILTNKTLSGAIRLPDKNLRVDLD
jgi:hypothetical protein